MPPTDLTPSLTRPRSNASEEETRQWVRAQALKSLYFFARVVLEFRDLTPSLHLPLCLFLQDARKRKLIIYPRSHFKSSLCTIAYPIWVLCHDPTARILIVNATATNAEHFLRKIKSVFQTNAHFQALFPERIPDWTKPDKWSETEIQVPRRVHFPEASIEAIGVGGRVTGRHYTHVIEDDLIGDPMDDMLVPTVEEHRRVIRWHEYAEGLAVKPEALINVVVGTRWHVADLYGHIQEHDPRYVAMTRQALEEGQPIFPERFSMETLAGLRERKPYYFNTQMMNDPIDASVVDFQEAWLKFFAWEHRPGDAGDDLWLRPRDGTPPIRAKDLTYYAMVDPAASTRSRASRSAVVVVGCERTGSRRFLVHVWAKRVPPPELLVELFYVQKTYAPRRVGIETVGNDLAYFVEGESRRQRVSIAIVMIRPTGDKDDRIRQVVGAIVSGGEFYCLPTQAEFLDEYRKFPLSQTKDILDALAHGPRIWALPEEEGEAEAIESADLEWVEAAGRNQVSGY